MKKGRKKGVYGCDPEKDPATDLESARVKAVLGQTEPETEYVLLAIAGLRARFAAQGKPSVPDAESEKQNPAVVPILWPDPSFVERNRSQIDEFALRWLSEATVEKLEKLMQAMNVRQFEESPNGLAGMFPAVFDKDRWALSQQILSIAHDAHRERLERAKDAWQRAGAARKGNLPYALPRWDDSPDTLDIYIKQAETKWPRNKASYKLRAIFAKEMGEPPLEPEASEEVKVNVVLEELNRLRLKDRTRKNGILDKLKERGVEVSERTLRDFLHQLGWVGRRGRPSQRHRDG